MTSKTILIAEDDRVFRERLAKSFIDRTFAVMAVASLSELVEVTIERRLDYAVIDLRLGHDSGLDVLRYLAKEHPLCRSVLLTSFGTIATSVEAIKLGAINYLPKPTNATAILSALEGEESERGIFSEQAPPTLAQAEWEHIQRVLETCDGNVTQAAVLLGLHRRSLQRKLSKYQIGLR
jgi:two-component system, response regulator RegA